MKTYIYWRTKNRDLITKIRNKLNLPSYSTVNGESPVDLNKVDLQLLKEIEELGYISIRKKIF